MEFGLTKKCVLTISFELIQGAHRLFVSKIWPFSVKVGVFPAYSKSKVYIFLALS